MKNNWFKINKRYCNLDNVSLAFVYKDVEEGVDVFAVKFKFCCGTEYHVQNFYTHEDAEEFIKDLLK